MSPAVRRVLPLLFAACGSSSPDATMSPDATPDSSPAVDAPPDASAGFGELSGMCGVLATTDFTSASPALVRDTFTFARAFVDPDDRPLLTAGGQHLAETPNAGGSSGLSEVFAYEQLARCEQAALYKTETEIIYDTIGKITDLEVTIDGHKLGVSVTRAVTFPFGDPYTLDAANALLTKKLEGIQESTMNVSAGDRWDKQFLAVLAWDDQAADTIAQSWEGLDANLKADTIVIVSSTAGEDLFIYSNM